MEEKNFEILDTEPVFIKLPIDKIMEDAKKIDYGKVGTEVLTWVIANIESFIDNQNKIFKLDLVLDNIKEMEETKKLQDLYRAIPDEEEDPPLSPNDETTPVASLLKKLEKEKELEKSQECRRMLDEITSKAFSHIKNAKDLLNQLFERMIFYYEKVIPNPENKKRALEIDDELKKLIKQKEEVIEFGEEKDEIQRKIVEKLKEGERLVRFTELEGSASIINFDYEAFSVPVQIVEGFNPNKTEEQKEKRILKSYVIPEGFTVWVEINFKYKMRPTNMF